MLQFGDKQPGLMYRDRPAAFGIAERSDLIAVVLVEKPGLPGWFDLPGGALDPGEDGLVAVVREFGEETGLVVRPQPRPFARAAQFFLNTDGSPFNNLAEFYQLAVEGEAPGLKIEDDHTLVWLEPAQALISLRHDAHAWALTAWLRRRR
ncbi:MAG: NUDIX domain-containing protein [Caulobacteraceae bacterium]|nr:NUDIX domain-containing protein [Caulobacteraceae bacterium]